MVIRDETSTVPAELTLRTAPNWTGVAFFAGLALLHLRVAVPAFLAGKWEGYLSLIFATLFIGAAIIAARFRFELTILAGQRQLRLRHGLRRFHLERTIPFAAVHGVRLTLPAPGRRPETARIELLCPGDDIVCPPTRIPRQQALYLAILMQVQLIKVMDDAMPGDSPIRDRSRDQPELSQDREA